VYFIEKTYNIDKNNILSIIVLMLAWIKDFYDSNKYAILWTVGYVIVTWAIMRYMFNFNIFSAHRWHQLMHAHLHGFAGFVFGILILAMAPLYVATTVVIARNNAPLFNFKITIPEFIKTFFKNAFTQTPLTAESESVTETQTVVTTQQSTQSEPEPSPVTAPVPEPVPAAVPAELRVAYTRARDNLARTQTSAFDLGNVTNKPATAPIADPAPQPSIVENEMPIPTDFDIEDTSKIMNDVPVFTDIDLDNEIDDDENESKNEPDINDVKMASADNDIVTKYLTARSVQFQIEDEVVVTRDFAIVSHTDSDFWVADNESWFAAGKIRKSPIASVMNAAAAHKVQPVIYLGADNIMDIDELRGQWEKSGIRVISDLKDLA